ncbi:histidinol-phosphate phosphatase [Mariprofundus ferrinatatus]|uniref:Histidinol-phosphatase n=1 Tax=Mariprofundus ferrinatatus TaxID=1921087 RepID=A0A2K8L3V7_9PROT|nr:histidinol-phosphatase HisJ [Mariprofundus ferrinatatus]ATX81933.1 histidinol-phosphate phosphatase [Mariprofundus ferrinatatus]
MRYQPVPDYHMHTPRCNHATGTVADYADAAIAAGLREIGMSDHSPMPGDYDKAWRMGHFELKDYITEVEHARKKYAEQLTIRLGIEADFHPGTETYVMEMIETHPWDYVIGSVHYIGDWGFDNPDTIQIWDTWRIEDAYCAYFKLVEQSAQSGLFNIIGHPDLIKKFGHRPPSDSKAVNDAIESMLQAVKKADVALEISSAGLRKPVGEIYPQARIVKRAAELGIPFSFGSDAHAPAEVGHAMNECLDHLISLGVTEIACFEKRQRMMLPIQTTS